MTTMTLLPVVLVLAVSSIDARRYSNRQGGQGETGPFVDSSSMSDSLSNSMSDSMSNSMSSEEFNGQGGQNGFQGNQQGGFQNGQFDANTQVPAVDPQFPNYGVDIPAQFDVYGGGEISPDQLEFRSLRANTKYRQRNGNNNRRQAVNGRQATPISSESLSNSMSNSMGVSSEESNGQGGVQGGVQGGFNGNPNRQFRQGQGKNGQAPK